MMKNLLILMSFALLFSASCKKDEEAGQPGEITITTSVSNNVVTYTASASDAVKFIWDLGNGETPEGATVTGTYYFAGDYTVKCTAKGRDTDRTKTITQKVEQGDPNIGNEVNKLLCGYDETTGESNTIWMWIDEENTFADGPREGEPDTVYFNPIDTTYWHNPAGELPEAALDDEYSFKLNSTMSYVNDFKTEFMVNWAWAASRGYATPTIWEDLAYAGYEAIAASWSVEHIENINDTLQFETYIGGTMMSGAYVIHLTNDASIGMESAGHDYQILRLTEDTLWLRYDNTFPEDLSMYDANELANEGVNPGEPDEAYLTLIRKQ